MAIPLDLIHLLRDLVQIGIALTNERDLGGLLKMILSEARRLTHAEAGTLFLREGDTLRFAVVENVPLSVRLGEQEMQRRLAAEPLPIDGLSLAGHVALTGQIINVPNAYSVNNEPYAFNAAVDSRTEFRTRSVLVVPLQEPSGVVLGVLELINALDEQGRPTSFHPGYEFLARSLASQAAVAIRNARLEELSFQDGLTGTYNRRYFGLRLEEEVQRHARSRQPVSVIMIDLDHFKKVNDTFGHPAGDSTLREVAELLHTHSRTYSVISRYGGDEFAVLLADTPKRGGTAYAGRIRAVIADHAFKHGRLTVSVGVAALPEDVPSAAELITAVDKALYTAKRSGRNMVATLAGPLRPSRERRVEW